MVKKKCWKCGKSKDVSKFVKNKSKKNGIGDICLICQKKRQRKYNKLYAEEIKEEKKKEELNACSGYKITILNYARKGEKKINILNTLTNEVKGFNNIDTLIEELRKL